MRGRGAACSRLKLKEVGPKDGGAQVEDGEEL